jgi:hypothetical protein
MTAFFEYLKINAVVVAAIISSLLALIGGLGGPIVALLIGRKQAAAAQTSAEASMLTAQKAGARAIATLRQEWIDTLRTTLAEYHSIMMSAKVPLSQKDDRAASNLGTRIELMLNPIEDASKELERVMLEIDNCETLDERVEMDPQFVAAARRVLKLEWDRVKSNLQ